LRRGEIHALCGDNGAGKSTLIKILAGVVPPDRGEIFVDNRWVSIPTSAAAQKLGIETVYQDLALADTLNAAENVYLGRLRLRRGLAGRLGLIDRRAMREGCRVEMDHLGIELPSVAAPVETLSGGQRQAVAVARAAMWGGKIIIMDEPVAALAPKQTELVLDLIRRVRDERGVSVLLISHSLPQVFEVAERVTVMRHGRSVLVKSVAETSTDELLRAMTGLSEVEPRQ
jgi:simple sugar transport system ATP-binding protein